MKTVVIPVVVGALGTETRRIVEDVKKVSEAHGICANPHKVLGVWTEWLTWVTDAQKKTPVKTVMEEIITMITHKGECDGIYEPAPRIVIWKPFWLFVAR